MATADAWTTRFSSVFMSATVCLTVFSKVASSSASTPAFACPRATRPTRPKISDKNAISCSPLRLQMPDNAPGGHHVDQQEIDAGQNIVFVVRPHRLDLAEIVQDDGRFAAARVIQLESGRGDTV